MVYTKLHILVGVRDHVSACCDRHARCDEPTKREYVPEPSIEQILVSKKPGKIRLPSTHEFILSSFRNTGYCRGRDGDLDTVALRMWAYVKDVGRQFRPWTQQINAHREDQRKISIDKAAARTEQKRRKAVALAQPDAEFTQQMDQMLQEGQPLQTEPGNVLLLVKNKGMMSPQFKENEILGMCARGLYVCVGVGDAVPKEPHLSCRWHCKKQFQDL